MALITERIDPNRGPVEKPIPVFFPLVKVQEKKSELPSNPSPKRSIFSNGLGIAFSLYLIISSGIGTITVVVKTAEAINDWQQRREEEAMLAEVDKHRFLGGGANRGTTISPSQPQSSSGSATTGTYFSCYVWDDNIGDWVQCGGKPKERESYDFKFYNGTWALAGVRYASPGASPEVCYAHFFGQGDYTWRASKDGICDFEEGRKANPEMPRIIPEKI